MRHFCVCAIPVACSIWAVSSANAQQLTLQAAVQRARASSPAITAARAAIDAAAARELQARAWTNPNLSYGREQTAHDELRNSQDIVSIDQRFEIGGQRSARGEAARLRRLAAEARLAAVQSAVDLEVARAYANALASDRRAELAAQAGDAFAAARRNSDQRLAAGDISGYAARRLKLEAARYTALSLEARQEQHAARLVLASLLSLGTDSVETLRLTPFGEPVRLRISLDSIDVLLERQAHELRAARLDADALLADARLAERDRVPTPTVLAGFKREGSGNNGGSLNGFVAGISIPLPLVDRRKGAIAAAQAEARRKVAELDTLRRTSILAARAAFAATTRMEQQVAALRAELGDEARLALAAAEAAYAEGEITLLEWLDAVRAYQEAEASYAQLSAQALIQRATLMRTLGLPVTEE